MGKVRCKAHGMIVCEHLGPCAEYPYGAIKIIDKHRGEPCENVISLSPSSPTRALESRSAHNPEQRIDDLRS
jgi:hypothetical protein